MIAIASFDHEEYARALLYIENYISEDVSTRFQEEIHFLAKIHAELLDSDSVEGLMKVKENEPSLDELIILYNATMRYHESTACFERLIQVECASPAIIKNMVDCYLNLDQPEMALLLSESICNRFNNGDNLMGIIRAEPLLRLSRWDELDGLLKVNKLNFSFTFLKYNLIELLLGSN